MNVNNKKWIWRDTLSIYDTWERRQVVAWLVKANKRSSFVTNVPGHFWNISSDKKNNGINRQDGELQTGLGPEYLEICITDSHGYSWEAIKASKPGA